MLTLRLPFCCLACATILHALHAGCKVANGERPFDGGCLPDAYCSGPPNNLYFTGTTLYDQPDGTSPPYAIALNGTETITVWLDSHPMDAFSSPNAFVARGTGSDIIKVLSSNPPYVTVKGQAAGQDELRITDPNGTTPSGLPGVLYDQITLDVVDLSNASVQVRVVAPHDADFRKVHGDVVDTKPIAFAKTSQPSSIVVGIFAPYPPPANTLLRRVVDESLTLSAGEATLSPTSKVKFSMNRWDSLIPDQPFDQATDYTIMMSNSPHTANLKVVNTVTRFTAAAGNVGIARGIRLTTGQTYRVCFSSFYHSGGEDLLVYGAKLHFQRVRADVVVTPIDGGSQIANSCADIRPLTSTCPIDIQATYSPEDTLYTFQDYLSFGVNDGCTLPVMTHR